MIEFWELAKELAKGKYGPTHASIERLSTKYVKDGFAFDEYYFSFDSTAEQSLVFSYKPIWKYNLIKFEKVENVAGICPGTTLVLKKSMTTDVESRDSICFLKRVSIGTGEPLAS